MNHLFPYRIIHKILKRILLYLFPFINDIDVRLQAIETTFEVLANSPSYEDDLLSLNQQVARRKIVSDILKVMQPQCIVETGTYIGNTTGWFAQFNAQVYSSEISKPLFYVAKQRLSKFNNVNLVRCDCRKLLNDLKDSDVVNKCTFLYLDAHWLDDLPLLEEIDIIDSNWEDYIIMIDDFQVPNDEGYNYDNYGVNRPLNYSYIKDIIEANSINVFFPNVPSAKETGYKRGYAFLARPGKNTSLLSAISELRLFKRNTII